MTPTSPSLRLLGYLRPYRGRLLGTALLMVAFALLSGISIGMISPFIKVLFTPRPAVVAGPPAPGAASILEPHAATGPLLGGAVPGPPPSVASDGARRESDGV